MKGRRLLTSVTVGVVSFAGCGSGTDSAATATTVAVAGDPVPSPIPSVTTVSAGPFGSTAAATTPTADAVVLDLADVTVSLRLPDGFSPIVKSSPDAPFGTLVARTRSFGNPTTHSVLVVVAMTTPSDGFVAMTSGPGTEATEVAGRRAVVAQPNPDADPELGEFSVSIDFGAHVVQVSGTNIARRVVIETAQSVALEDVAS